MMTKGTITEFAEEISNLEEHGKCLFNSRDLCHSSCFLRLQYDDKGEEAYLQTYSSNFE